MANKRDKILAIFIEESTEIIEQLETEIIALEDSPWDKSIINEIFRAVHTLKGNANSFNFTNLGGFVHYFEDLLDFFRDPNQALEDGLMDLFYEAYDIIKQVFEAESDGDKRKPDNYESVLNKIKSFLDKDNKSVKSIEPIVLDEVITKNEYHHDFYEDSDLKYFEVSHTTKVLNACSNGKKVYNIVMKFDNDLYLRGYNHILFFKLFSSIGDILLSLWSVNVPDIENFTSDDSYITRISLFLISDVPMEDVQDVFEFIAEDEEVGISVLDCNRFLEQDTKSEASEDLAQDFIDDNKEDNIESKQNVESSNSSNGNNGIEPPSNSNGNNNEEHPNNSEYNKISFTKSKSIRIESIKLDDLFDSIGELVIAQSYIDQNKQIRDLNNPEINQYLGMLNKITRLIQNKVMSLRMIPIRDTFFKMKRVTRDVSRKTGKEIELFLHGEETEIDKTMVDSLSEPLIHLIRNAIDHGIEDNSSKRLDHNKPFVGRVDLSAMHKGSNFIIEIKDDGRGIDFDKILEKAIEKGMATDNKEYTQHEIAQFLFLPGFSTAKEVTDVSGRGVGLDAVHQSIADIKGKVQVESELGVGSIFRIILPLTLAIIDGMSVRVEEQTFIIPTLAVVESFRAKDGEIQKAKGKGEFFNFRGEILPVLKLYDLLGLKQEQELNAEDSTLICIEHEKGRYILQVNELLGRQQVVIKPLNKQFKIQTISGAAIMGNGNIALILNIEGIRDWLDHTEGLNETNV